MSDFQIQIDDAVVLPKREAHFGVREGKYTKYLKAMKQGQGFAVPIKGVEGATTAKGDKLTAAQDAERKARQRQSAMSNTGKKLGIKLDTRFIAKRPSEAGYLQTKWDQMGGPYLLVVHGGERPPEEVQDAPADPEADDDLDLGDE